MNAVVARLSGRLQDGQIMDGFQAEAWAICERVPQAVVFPESRDQVAELLSIANEEGWHCIPCGSGTWLRGGRQPRAVDLVGRERKHEFDERTCPVRAHDFDTLLS